MHKLATIVTAAVQALVCHVALATTFYVGPDGHDTWSGRLPRANRDGTDGPLASLAGARDAVRRLKTKSPLSEPMHVVIADGRYTLPETLTFAPDDSGTENCPISYEGAPGARPVISGGRVVTGWKEHGGGIWKAPCPVENTRQLYVNGQRAIRAHGPVPTGLEPLGNEGYRTRDPQVLHWRNLEDVEFCYLVVWSHSRCKIAAIVPDGQDKTRAVIEITGNSVYRVPTPMNYNNRAQNRIKTCREHDNFFQVQPPPQQVVDQAGIRGQ
jgi:hypothetical protein